MSAYRKFSDALQNQALPSTAPKPPKAPKVGAPVAAREPDQAAAQDAHDIEKRAANVEYWAGAPRAWAEGFARLNPDRPPGDVPAARWLMFVDDIGRFLDSGFAETATALGWGPLDLFGSDRDRPFARIDQAGLLWLLGGNKLIALTASTATIELSTGSRQTYRRKPEGPGRA